MKTTNLICNVCKATEVIEDSGYGSHGAGKVGWVKVLVMELRPPTVEPHVARTTKALKKLASHEAMPQELTDVFKDMAGMNAEREPFPMPVQRSADICPKCVTKTIGSLLPHVTSDSPRGMGMVLPPSLG